MYIVSWQVIPFTHNANKERIVVTITNRSFQVKFIAMVTVSKLYAYYWQTQRNLG